LLSDLLNIFKKVLTILSILSIHAKSFRNSIF
jgi:hypothetical protein